MPMKRLGLAIEASSSSDEDNQGNGYRQDNSNFNTMSCEFGTEGLKIIKENIQVSKHGLKNLTTGEFFGTFNPQDLRYIGELGRGACGLVLRALHVPSGVEFAVKSINVYEKDRRH